MAINGERLPQINIPKISAENTYNPPLSMLISCGRDETIDTNEFISKINSGKPLSEEERSWACRQFDAMAENSGAGICGMLVNGEPIFKPEWNGDPEYEDKAKCVLISSALEGKRIAAVPIDENGLPNVKIEPSPVTVLDTVETIKSLWERILEFFSLGRSNKIEKSNDLSSSKRTSDTRKFKKIIESGNQGAESEDELDDDLKEKCQEILDKAKPDDAFAQKAGQLRKAANREVSRREELMNKNYWEFVSGMYPDVKERDQKHKQDIGYMIQNAVSYTDEKGKNNSSFLSTLVRDGSLTHFMYLYGIARKGYTLDQMLFSDKVDRAALGREFLEEFSIKKLDEFAKDNQLDATAEETRKSYNEYVIGKQQDVVKLSAEMFDSLKKQEFTAPDPSDPESMIANYVKQSTLFMMVGDFSQVFGSMNNNKTDPSSESVKRENERATAMSNYEYFSFTPMQTYSTVYDKYMRYLTDLAGKGIPKEYEDRTHLDMAAFSKCSLEGAAEWTNGKKTVGDILSDEKLSNHINSMASACAGSDENYKSGIMDKVNLRYLSRTAKDMDYIRLDPEHYTVSRLGIESSNEDYMRISEQDVVNARTELAKFVPEGFENNLAKSYSKFLEQNGKEKAPVREKMGFNELLGSDSKKASKVPASSEKQLENEKSMGSMSK